MNYILKQIFKAILKLVFIVPILGVSQPVISVGFVSVTTISNNKINISVIKTDGIDASQFVYYKLDKFTNRYTEIARTTANSFTDSNVDINKQAYCYKVSYINSAGKESDMSQEFCSVNLSLNTPNSIKWTPFSKLQNSEPVDYFVDIVNQDGSINRLTSSQTQELSLIINTIEGIKDEFDALGQAIIRIRAIQRTTFDLNGFTFSNHPIAVYSNFLTIYPPPEIFVPNTFTPNEDGKNDEFLAIGVGIQKFEMLIFDRWGNVIFETTDIKKGWNGLQNGGNTLVLPGEYAYVIKATDNYDNSLIRKGVVTLLK